MTKEDILKLYGKHIYAIRLELAMRFYTVGSPAEAFKKADHFIEHMMSDKHKEFITS